MNQAQINLKTTIEKFIKESFKTITHIKQSSLSECELKDIAQSIIDMKKYVIELLETNPNESTWYNCSIIKGLLEESIQVNKAITTSLVKAATEFKIQDKQSNLLSILQTISREKALSEVFFDDLFQISEELTG